MVSEGSQHDQEARTAAARAERLDRWTSNLLDLSLRNRLLNYRETQRSIPLLCPDLGALEDALAASERFELWSRPERPGDAPADEEAERALLLRDLDARRLHSSLSEAELVKRQVTLYRASRRDLQEGGANTLFLALGFLAWFESPTSETRRLAPLILLPMELVRGTARDPFGLRRAEDDSRLNVSLIQKLALELEIEVTGLDEVPTDESGLDVPLIFDRFRRAVDGVDRLEVVEEAVLGSFSFSTFLMWRDLEQRREGLLDHPVVRHLVGGGVEPWPEAESTSSSDRPSEPETVLDADSSQLAAVSAAVDQGRSFVLEGPPGTGKSQTITNIIASALSRERRVLFVSDKMAALEVVRARLEQVGLGPFCLELHSNKARKADVVAQLGRALELGEAPAEAPPGDDTQLRRARKQLDRHVEALHSSRPLGQTLFQVTSRLIELRQAPAISVDLGRPEQMTGSRLEGLRERWQRLTSASAAVAPIADHPFAAARRTDWDPSLPGRVSEAAREARSAASELGRAAADLQKLLGLSPPAEPSLRQLGHLDELAEKLLQSPGPPPALLSAVDWSTRRGEIEGWVAAGRRHDELRAQLAERFNPDRLLALDLDRLRLRFGRWATAFVLLAWLMLLTARCSLRRALRSGRHLPPRRQVPLELDRAVALREQRRQLDRLDGEATTELSGFWIGPETDWTRLEELLGWCQRVRELWASVGVAAGRPPGQALVALAADPSAQLVPGGEAAPILGRYRQAWEALRQRRAELVELLELDEVEAFGAADAPELLRRLDERLASWEAEATGLRDACAFCRLERELKTEGLGPVTAAYRRGRVASSELDATFERAVAQWWWEATVAGDERLARFHGVDHEHTVARFRQFDRESLDEARRRTRARLEADVAEALADETLAKEVQLLRREVKKKRRHLPLRTLFERIPALATRLAPCLLMSPLSVAQYLGADHPSCDLVVFDEASQIPVWEAIGAVARGDSVVVVGDSQQLPPTRFFQADLEADEPAGEEELEELESILDECVAAGMPRRRLLWHYRSRHEDLITFSNRRYYEGSLLTFPCAEAGREDLGVSWHEVTGGRYDRSRSRTNRAEAEAVVAEVTRRLLDQRDRTRSIGVVTFSQAQQRLIEDLLDEARREQPEMEEAFDQDAAEPLFVKNLENVQGDERDVVLFSIGYGPDADGRVSMNFGPLNRRGGYRRLNVAVTRSREQMVVFSTLRPEQIDLSRTSSEAVEHLKSFLSFAAAGVQVLDEPESLEPSGRRGAFERALARAIEQMDYEVRAQVGCSGYRVDIGVVDPEAPERFLLGVEGDGRNYGSATSTRDRDRLRAEVLERLGWRLHRCWSIDLWLDPEGELARLRRALDEALEPR